MEFKEFLKNAAAVKPTARQLSWYDTEFYCFLHFGVNTFTNREWGLGDEPESIFNPVKLDCNQWAAAAKSAGMRAMILTAKHHDGFCLWPSKYTEHSVKNSPWKDGKGDVVRECAEACRKAGLKFGFYLSPWDRNSKYYGTDAYNDYYKAQLTELLTEYGDIFCVWLDGACGEGPNGKKQVYDFKGIIELVRKYQPGAVIFNDGGPDVRWCGNESGSVRHAEWAVVPHELAHFADVQTEGSLMDGSMDFIKNTNLNCGSLQQIVYSKGLSFCGSEVDMSIRPGWFWHKAEEPHSLDRLFKTYLGTVGGNCCFHLNLPPTTDGLIDERDVQRLKELGELIRSSFANPIPFTSEFKETSETQCEMTFRFDGKKKISYVVLREKIAEGQRVESFLLQEYNDSSEQFEVIYDGTCIGHKKICPVKTETNEIKLLITGARDRVLLDSAEFF